MADIILKDESYKLIGLCMEVHCELGMGFKEVIYQDALDLELVAVGRHDLRLVGDETDV